MTQCEERQFFADIMRDSLRLWLWEYDGSFARIGYNGPAAEVSGGPPEDALRVLAQEGQLPGVASVEAGLAWAVAAEARGPGEGRRYFALGPVRLAEEWREAGAGGAPLASLRELRRYAALLNRAVNGAAASPAQESRNAGETDKSVVALLARMQEKVRNGDLSYKELVAEVLSDHQSLMRLGAVTADGARKVALLSMDLCCQAALEGGLAEKSIAALRSEYLPRVASAGMGPDIARECDAFMRQLVRLVRRAKGKGSRSEPVLACCAYIEEHVCEKLSVEALAQQAGYTPDYLSKVFRQEAGESLKSYVLRAKIHRAQFLLTTSDMPIGDIAGLLSFCSSSHFTRVFQQYAKDTPANFRAKHSHMP